MLILQWASLLPGAFIQNNPVRGLWSVIIVSFVQRFRGGSFYCPNEGEKLGIVLPTEAFERTAPIAKKLIM